MDKDIIKLYLTVVNGKTGESGEVEGVSRAIFPTGKYRLVQSNLEYVVVPEFPKEAPPDLYGVYLDWGGFYDRYLYNDSVKKRVWDPFVLSPNKYRTPGLALSQKRMEELNVFLEKDTKTENDHTRNSHRQEKNTGHTEIWNSQRRGNCSLSKRGKRMGFGRISNQHNAIRLY